MLDELLIENQGRRYVGHVWSVGGKLKLARQPTHYWRFAHRGRLIAEFPATALDTPETVKSRLLSTLARIQSNRTNKQTERRA